MQRPFIHSLIAWLCLFSFGLDMAVHAIGPVFCTSVDGHRLEWVCEKDDRGACLQAVVEADAPDRHTQESLPPCDDQPVGEDHDQGHHLITRPTEHGQAAFTFPPMTMAALPPFACDPLFRCSRPWVEVRVRPPDTVARLRTIIMIV